MGKLAVGEPWPGEFEVRRRDDTTFPAQVTTTPLLDEHGNVTAFVGVSADVSERKRAEEALRATAAPAAEEAEVQKAGRPAARRILIADDNRDAATSLAMVLRLMGHETQTAYDGAEAVEAAAGFEPEVVLLDLGMPKLDGYEACRRLRAQNPGSGILLVALTGWGQEEDRRRSRESGFDHHLTKPVDLTQTERLLAGAGGE